MAKPTIVQFDRITRRITLSMAWRKSEASFTHLVCNSCGVMVCDDAENKQKHANFHGEVKRLQDALVAHRNSGSHIIGPLA